VDNDRTVTNRPLAGTRRRGVTPEADLATEKELLADQKEVAEHVMLVDLGRNDVGKVSSCMSVCLSVCLSVLDHAPHASCALDFCPMCVSHP